MKSRILSAVSISLLLILYYSRDGRACMFNPTEHQEYRFGLFAPYSAKLRMYDAMYFSFFRMHDFENTKGVEEDRRINVDEWYEYLQHQVDKKEIDALLYHITPAEFSEMLHPRRNAGNDALIRNGFFQYLQKPEHKKVFDYIRYAKQVESMTGSKNDPWDDEFYIPPGLDIMPDVIDSNIAALGNDDFLKARYHYLNIRYVFIMPADTTYYSKHIRTDEAKEYAELMAMPIKTVVKGWAAYFDANFKSFDNKAKGNYLIAQAFNLSNDKKVACFREFSVKLLEQSARYARNNRELANLYSLAAMKNSDNTINNIEKVYHLDPTNPNLHFLMVREISKLEDKVFTQKYTGFGVQVTSAYDGSTGAYTNTFADRLHLSRWREFMTASLVDSLPKDRFFFNLCMAHTCLMDGKADEAKSALAEAKKYPPADTELICQYKLTDLAVKISAAEKMDAGFENEILPILKWLDAHKESIENPELVFKQLHLFLSKKYEEKGMHARAILTRSRYNWYASFPTVASGYYFEIDSSLYLYLQESSSAADVEAFVNILRKKDKTPFEKYYADAGPTGSYMYNMAAEVAGSDYLREADYTSAQRMFSLIDDTYWKTGWKRELMKTYLNADPFTARPLDCHASPSIKDTLQRYNKKTFTTHLVKLLKEDANKPDSLIRIADAMYNMTYFGNSWILVRNSWSAYDNVFSMPFWGQGNTLSPRYVDYYACRRARQWYQQAYSRSSNKEIKAKALLMMAQCDKNYAYLLAPNRTWQSTALFDQFAGGYADTRYYRDLTSLCEIKEVKRYFYQFSP